MRAAYKNKGGIIFRDIDSPVVSEGLVKIKVDACGICGTDLHDFETAEEAPFGHEVAGTVIEAGAFSRGLEPGDKVVLDSATPCGYCGACKNGEQELCSDIQSFFYLGSFGFAEEMIAPAISAVKYTGLSLEVASLQEPLGVAIDVVRLAEITTNSNVLIMGQGPIGLMALALARKAGARRVFVSNPDRRTARKKLAEKFGADEHLDPVENPPDEFDFKCRIDRVIVTTPPPTLNTAFKTACKGAIISFIGIGVGDKAFCSFDVNAFHFKKLQLRASFASPAMFGPMALSYLREGVIDGEALVSHRFPLEQLETAVNTAARDPEAVKVVVKR